jgi:putative membrane protein
MRETFHYTIALAIALLMTVALSAQAPAAQAPSAQPKAGPSLSANDRTFVMTAGQGGYAEVEIGNLAVKKATNPAVKGLAEHLVKDHSANNEELKTLASAKGVIVASTLDKEHQQLDTRLQKLEGAAFDRDYASAMVNGHKKMIGLFEQASKSKDPEIRAFAEKTLPTLREHLKEAQQAQAAVGGAKSTSGTKPSSTPSSTPAPPKY